MSTTGDSSRKAWFELEDMLAETSPAPRTAMDDLADMLDESNARDDEGGDDE